MKRRYGMDSNRKYYETNAASFFATTVAVDMSSLRSKFAAHISSDGHILDAGCGSGRDAKAFADLGFRVTAFDASETLAQLATAHCGFPVEVRGFDEVNEVEVYDGIWCCASLLHVPSAEMPRTLGALWGALKPEGALYVSFKLGEGERKEDGRTFTDADDDRVRAWLGHVANTERVEIWRSPDARPERAEEWVNAIAIKSAVPRRKLVTGVRTFGSFVTRRACFSFPAPLACCLCSDRSPRDLCPGVLTVERLVPALVDHRLPPNRPE